MQIKIRNSNNVAPAIAPIMIALSLELPPPSDLSSRKGNNGDFLLLLLLPEELELFLDAGDGISRFYSERQGEGQG
ncbi:hypothetical protein Tco_0201147 [Tanacetum coccineum]